MTSNSHTPWTVYEENFVRDQFLEGVPPETIAETLQRTVGAIKARLERLGIGYQWVDNSLDGKPGFKLKSSRPSTSAHKPSATLCSGTARLVATTNSGVRAAEKEVRTNYCGTVDPEDSFSRFFFVYCLVNPEGRIYVGYSADVWARIRRHNMGIGESRTEAFIGPWVPFAIYSYASQADALNMEASIIKDFDRFHDEWDESIAHVLTAIGYPGSKHSLEIINHNLR